MAKLRSKKVSDFIKREISRIITYDLRHPDKGMITVTHVRMTDDLSIAYVYFTSLGSEEQISKSLDVLNASAKFLRGQLAKNMKLKKMPQLKFFKDDSLQYANKIDGIFDDLDKEKKAELNPEDYKDLDEFES
jgi:ribosome-binding factor A